MVAWGMIVALTCLVNSYRGLIVYAVRSARQYFRSYRVAFASSLVWLKEDSFLG